MHIRWSTIILMYSHWLIPFLLWLYQEKSSFLSRILQVNTIVSKSFIGKPIATPEKAIEALSTLQLSFLKKNQIKIQDSSNQLVQIEVSPLVSIRDEGYWKLKDVEICLPCCVYDHTEVDLAEEEYQKVTNSIVLLTHKRDGCFIYVVL